MDRTLQHLADRTEIAELVNRLGIVLDEGRFDEMPALVVEDARVRTPGGTSEGREALVAQARRNHRPDQPIQHLITNLAIDLDGDGDGDRAAARANLVVHFGPPTPPTPPTPATPAPGPDALPAPQVQYTLGEVYRFDLVRTSAGWRFAGIETTAVWSSGTRPTPVPPA